MGKVLLVIGLPDDLGLYMPQFVPIARAAGREVHLLEVSGAAGMGMFGDELAGDGPAPSHTRNPAEYRTSEDSQPFAAQVNVNLERFADYLRGAGPHVSSDWQPDLELSQLPAHVRRVETDTVAIIERTEWLQR